MTHPSAETIERQRDQLYVTDLELYRRLGVPKEILAQVIPELELRQGFPRKSKIFGGRRYWPAVKAWLDNHHGINMDAPQQRRDRYG